MSGIDENPFADPYGSNPFADQSVTSATGTTARLQSGLNDYNPFASQPVKPQEPQGRVNVAPTFPKTFDPPATIKTTPESPPPYKPVASQKANINTAELQKRQEELERKAADLQAREEALKTANFDPRANNWPPLPAFCCAKPCFYQDIALDIPQEFQKTVRALYYLWLYYVCVLCLNFVGSTALMIQFKMFISFGVAALTLVLFVPASFLCWFRAIYKAFRSDSSFFFMVFFFMFFFQTIVCGIYAIGITNFGSCGFIVGIEAMTSDGGSVGNKVVGVMVLLIAVLWTLATLMSVLMLFKVHRIYRMSGASINKAQEEFTQGILTNEHVQAAATNVAVGAARGAVQQTLSGGNQRNNPF